MFKSTLVLMPVVLLLLIIVFAVLTWNVIVQTNYHIQADQSNLATCQCSMTSSYALLSSSKLLPKPVGTDALFILCDFSSPIGLLQTTLCA